MINLQYLKFSKLKVFRILNNDWAAIFFITPVALLFSLFIFREDWNGLLNNGIPLAGDRSGTEVGAAETSSTVVDLSSLINKFYTRRRAAEIGATPSTIGGSPATSPRRLHQASICLIISALSLIIGLHDARISISD